jgi:hypothetical protein
VHVRPKPNERSGRVTAVRAPAPLELSMSFETDSRTTLTPLPPSPVGDRRGGLPIALDPNDPLRNPQETLTPSPSPCAQGEGETFAGPARSRHVGSVAGERFRRSVGVTETAWGQFAAGDLARPLVEGGARLGAGLEEVTGRPTVAAGGFAVDRGAGRAVEHEIAWVEFAERIDHEAVRVALDPGELARVVVFEDAHGALPLHCRKALSAFGSTEHLTRFPETERRRTWRTWRIWRTWQTWQSWQTSQEPGRAPSSPPPPLRGVSDQSQRPLGARSFSVVMPTDLRAT